MPRAKRRVQLLEAARLIIHQDGVGALTMAALADAVGISKPIVYNNFSNKEEVLIAILKEHSQQSIEYAASRVEGSCNIFEYFDNIIESMFDHIEKEGAIVRKITNGFSSNEAVDAYFLKMNERAHRVYCHLLMQQGASQRDANFAGFALMEMINMTVLEFASRSDKADRVMLKQMVRGAIHGIIHGQGIKPSIPAELLDLENET